MFKKNLEGKITKVDDQLGNSKDRPHLITKDDLTNEVEVTPISKSTNYDNHLEITATPKLKNDPSYLVVEKRRLIERLKAEANLTGQTVNNRNEIFKKIRQLEQEM